MTATATTRLDPEPGESPALWSALGALLVVVLVVNGLLSLVLEVLYLPIYIGGTPFPITVAFAAVINVILVRAMGAVVARPAALALPILAWLLGFLVCASSGPGGDVLLTDRWPTPLLLAGGLIPAGAYLLRKMFARPRIS